MNRRPKPWVFPVQILASLSIIGLLIMQADLGRVRAELAGASLSWLLVATLIKSASLTLHEVRLWISMMPDHKRPAWPVIGIGYTSGLANAVLPARGGDIVAVALLKKEQGVPVPAAVAAASGPPGFCYVASQPLPLRPQLHLDPRDFCYVPKSTERMQ